MQINKENIKLYFVDGIDLMEIVNNFEIFLMERIIIPGIKNNDIDKLSQYNLYNYFNEDKNFPIKGYYEFEWQYEKTIDNKKYYNVRIYNKPGYKNPGKYINGLLARKFLTEYYVELKNNE